MATVVLLDAGLVGWSCTPPRTPGLADFTAWLDSTPRLGLDVYIADVTRY